MGELFIKDYHDILGTKEKMVVFVDVHQEVAIEKDSFNLDHSVVSLEHVLLLAETLVSNEVAFNRYAA